MSALSCAFHAFRFIHYSIPLLFRSPFLSLGDPLLREAFAARLDCPLHGCGGQLQRFAARALQRTRTHGRGPVGGFARFVFFLKIKAGLAKIVDSCSRGERGEVIVGRKLPPNCSAITLSEKNTTACFFRCFFYSPELPCEPSLHWSSVSSPFISFCHLRLSSPRAHHTLPVGGDHGGPGPAQEHLRPERRHWRQQPRVAAAQRVRRRLSLVLGRGTPPVGTNTRVGARAQLIVGLFLEGTAPRV